MKSFVIILFLSISNLLMAQNNFKGTVDAETEKPIVGAVIYAFELNKSVVTDKNGSFTTYAY